MVSHEDVFDGTVVEERQQERPRDLEQRNHNNTRSGRNIRFSERLQSVFLNEELFFSRGYPKIILFKLIKLVYT